MIKSIASALAAALLASSALAQVPYTFGNQSGTVPASELDANFSYLSTVRAPVNLVPNSQWEIWSGYQAGTALKPDATGYEATIAASGNTTGALGYTTLTLSSAGANDLSVGDLVTVTGSGIDVAFTDPVHGEAVPLRVTAIPDSTHITVRLPFGKTASVSAAETITPLQIGASWSASGGGGAAPDGWGRFPTNSGNAPILWRDFLRGNYVVNSPGNVGAYAALGVKLQTAGLNLVTINIPSVQMPLYAGKTVVFGIYGMQKIQGGSDTWQVYFQDSVNGRITGCAHSAAPVGVYTWLECSYTIPANATSFSAGISLLGAAGDAYYYVDPTLAIGNYIGGVKNYTKPKNELLIPSAHVGPQIWINQAITFPSSGAECGSMSGYCFIVDPYADTGGVVAPTVLKARGQLEGIDNGAVQAGTGLVRVMAWFDNGIAPQKSGSFLSQYVQNVKSFSYMDFPFFTNTTLDVMGTGVFQSNVSGDTWTNVSMEMDEFVLQ